MPYVHFEDCNGEELLCSWMLQYIQEEHRDTILWISHAVILRSAVAKWIETQL